MQPRIATWADILHGAVLLYGDRWHIRITVEELSQDISNRGNYDDEVFKGHSPQYANDKSKGWIGHRRSVDAGDYMLVEEALVGRPERF